MPRRIKRPGMLAGGDGSTLSLDFTAMSGLDSRFTFSRTTLGTYVHSDGLLYGADTSTSSQTIGSSGTKTFTLTATAGVNRRYAVGDTVIASSGANNMSGTVTSYDPATQVLVFTATTSTGSGTLATWIIGSRMARFDHNPTTFAARGLLIEGSATNLALNGSMAYTATAPTSWSRGFSNSTVASVDSTTFPGQKAWSIAATAGGQRDILSQVISFAANTTYVVSIYLEAVTGQTATFAYVESPPSGATSTTIVNPSAGRVSFTVTIGATAGNGTLRIGIGASTGTGVSADASVRFSHVQVETGSVASSYIPTGASQGSRVADECSMTGTNFSSWFTNNSEGSFLVRYSMNSPSAFLGSAIDRYAYEISNSSGTSRVFCNASYRVTSAGDAGRFPRVFDLGTIDLAPSLVATAAQNTAFAWGYKSNDNHLAAVGVTANDTSGSLQTEIDRLHLGASRTFGSATYLQGCISLLKYWPTRLPNATLQSLTQ